jgi:hypothetical protein
VLERSFGISNDELQASFNLQDDLTLRMTELASYSTDDNRERTRGGQEDDTRNEKREEGQSTTKPLGFLGGSGVKRENLPMHQALPWEELLANDKLSDEEVFFVCPSSIWLCLLSTVFFLKIFLSLKET